MTNTESGTPTAIQECRYTGQAMDLNAITGGAQPLVIRALVHDWPIVGLARQSDSDFAKYLAKLDNGTVVDTLLMPPQAEGIVGYQSDLSAFNFEHYQIPLTLGLQRLAHYSRTRDGSGLAIQSALISSCMPSFGHDHQLPLPLPEAAPRIWIGNHVTTPAHFDSQYNIACVVCGRRRFTLFPPDQLPNLYIGPPDFAPTGAPISLARVDRPDDPRFPRLKQALAAAQVAELAPGDAIFIPPLWWHHVKSLEQLNALVNYWWPPVTVEGYNVGHEMAALYHCILAFRALPPVQREAWRNLLDHYVFGDEDPLAHVPPARHGVLGRPLTPERVTQLKELARRHL